MIEERLGKCEEYFLTEDVGGVWIELGHSPLTHDHFVPAEIHTKPFTSDICLRIVKNQVATFEIKLLSYSKMHILYRKPTAKK